MADCNALSCDTGYLDIEQVLLRLFAVDENGCVGLKIMWLWGDDCEGFTSLDECGQVLTVEQAVKMAVVNDGCGGWALGSFFISPPGPEPL
jgi:hypothetical protein